MLDLHCHLLHGIDDGPETLGESLDLCRIAVADGISHAITTPHVHPGRWENTRESIRKKHAQLQSALCDEAIPLQLGFAGEVRLGDHILQQVIENDIPFYGTVDGYRIMLLEFPHGHIVPGSDKLVAWLIHHKIRPLIAHPERNKQIMKDPGQLLPFLELGCWVQITAGSVLGLFGERAQKVAQDLLDQNMVQVIASDGHNSGARKPVLSTAYAFVEQRYGAVRAENLFDRFPASIVGGG